jgi:predicted nucleic acid-binding protein
VSGVVYDTGVLIAADRSERATWAEHRVRLAFGIIPCVPAAVVAQASRSDRQVQLRRFLRGCDVIGFDEPAAHRAGALLGKAKTTDVVDASLVDLAVTTEAELVTTDVADIRRLVAATGKRIVIHAR